MALYKVFYIGEDEWTLPVLWEQIAEAFYARKLIDRETFEIIRDMNSVPSAYTGMEIDRLTQNFSRRVKGSRYGGTDGGIDLLCHPRRHAAKGLRGIFFIFKSKNTVDYKLIRIDLVALRVTPTEVAIETGLPLATRYDKDALPVKSKFRKLVRLFRKKAPSARVWSEPGFLNSDVIDKAHRLDHNGIADLIYAKI